MKISVQNHDWEISELRLEDNQVFVFFQGWITLEFEVAPFLAMCESMMSFCREEWLSYLSPEGCKEYRKERPWFNSVHGTDVFVQFWTGKSERKNPSAYIEFHGSDDDVRELGGHLKKCFLDHLEKY